MKMRDAIQLFVERAPSVYEEALKAVSASDVTLHLRYNLMCHQALRDPEAQWTQAEFHELLELLEVTEEAGYSTYVRVRLTAFQKATLEVNAAERNMSVSAYIRDRVLATSSSQSN